MRRQLVITTQVYPVAGEFKISRSTLTHIPVVMVEIHDGAYVGRGECRPYKRYNQTVESVTEEIESVRSEIESGISKEALQRALPANASRNALDCALWDLEAKKMGKAVWELLGLDKPKARETAYTLSINTPDEMAAKAVESAQHKTLKLKIGNISGLDACLAILEARPDAQLIIDANEALNPDELKQVQNELSDHPIIFIEQPLPADIETSFNPQQQPIICADEALHTVDDLPRLWSQGYRAINVKLDKCGGLSSGYQLLKTGKAMGFKTMAGCMVGSSLAMAPMMMLESLADVIDLDGPLLLKEDIDKGLTYKNGKVWPPIPALWG